MSRHVCLTPMVLAISLFIRIITVNIDRILPDSVLVGDLPTRIYAPFPLWNFDHRVGEYVLSECSRAQHGHPGNAQRPGNTTACSHRLINFSFIHPFFSPPTCVENHDTTPAAFEMEITRSMFSLSVPLPSTIRAGIARIPMAATIAHLHPRRRNGVDDAHCQSCQTDVEGFR